MGRLTKRIDGKYCFTENGCTLEEVLRKLAHYEDLEEAERLIELPCALNTEVYFITQKSDGTYEIATMHLATYDQCINIGQHIGEKWLSLTKEEAEAKLKELEGDK